MDYVTIDYVYLTLYEKWVYNNTDDSNKDIIMNILNDIKSMYVDAIINFDDDMNDQYKNSLEDKYE